MHSSLHSVSNDHSTAHNIRNLIVNYLPDSVGNTELHNLFQKFGAIESTRVIRDKNLHAKGYGFVKFVNVVAAQQAMNEMNGYVIGAKRLKVGPAYHENLCEARQQGSRSMNPPHIERQALPPHAIPFFTMIHVTPPPTIFIVPVITCPISAPMNASIGPFPPQQNHGFFSTAIQPPPVGIGFIPR